MRSSAASDVYKRQVQSMRGQRISLIRVIAPLEEPKPSEEERAADVRSGVERAIREHVQENATRSRSVRAGANILPDDLTPEYQPEQSE